MATLTEVAYHTRRTIKWGSIILLFLIVFRWVWNAFWAYWIAKHPPPLPPPTVAFGQLPAINFPESPFSNLTYRLETITGTTPDLGDRAPVFFMPVTRPNLLALQRATDQANLLGFTNPPEKLTDTHYRWTITSPLTTTLEMDIIHGNFVLDTTWQQDPEILGPKSLPAETQAVLEAQEFLSDAGLLAEDLKNGRTHVSFWRISATDLIPAPSLSEADFVRVDLFRQNRDEGQILTASPTDGIVQIIFSGATTRGRRIIKVSYNYFPVDYPQSATYPVKSSAQAWEQLKAGQGFVASFTSITTEVTVRKVTLGFFDAPTPQTFLQPIYVFEGDNNFVGYVPAVSSDWVQE
ncbi:MAG: hypothetical protein HY381_02500 [Candidatus Chisholmbacteria bacterium]|nr:hypothetical protein [Candidatus Chisholmbacteria bacterium]